MNQTSFSILTLFIAIALTGCGRTAGMATGEGGIPIAVVAIENGFGVPSIRVAEIDGRSTNEFDSSYRIDAGSHEFTVQEKIPRPVRALKLQPEPQIFSAVLASGGNYQLRGRRDSDSGLTCIWLEDKATSKSIAFTPVSCKGYPVNPDLPSTQTTRSQSSVPTGRTTASTKGKPPARSLPAYDRSCKTDGDCVSAAEVAPSCFQHCRESACEGAFIDTCQVFNRESNFSTTKCAVSAICKKPSSISCVQGVCTKG